MGKRNCWQRTSRSRRFGRGLISARSFLLIREQRLPRHRQKSEATGEIVAAAKRRLVDDLLRIRASTIQSDGRVINLNVTPAQEKSIATRFGQILYVAKQSPGVHPRPIEWARAQIIQAIKPLPEFSELVPLVDRVVDEERLRACASDQKPALPTATKKGKATSRHVALSAIAELWRAEPSASYIDICERANELKVPTPWKGHPDWVSAMANNEGACKTLLAKARAMAREHSRLNN